MTHSNGYADMFPNFGVTIYPEKIEFSYTEINLNMPPEADNIL